MLLSVMIDDVIVCVVPSVEFLLSLFVDYGLSYLKAVVASPLIILTLLEALPASLLPLSRIREEVAVF